MKKETRAALAGAGGIVLAALIWTGGMVLLALGAKLAFRQGYIDYDTVLRIVAMNGLWIAWLGNRLPKTFAPHPVARQVSRFSGWAFVMSGLAYAGLWAFAPITVAIWGGTGAIVTAAILTLGHCFWVAKQSATPQ